MQSQEEIDQFQLLEQKVDSLIEVVKALKQEKAALAEKVQVQEEKLADLNEELGRLKVARDKARERVVALLEKIDRIDV